MFTAHPHRARPRSRLLVTFLSATLLASLFGVGRPDAAAPAGAADAHVASAFEFREPPAAPCLEPTINGFLSTFYVKAECLRMRFALSSTPVSANADANVELIGPAGGAAFATIPGVQEGDNDWMILTTVDPAWPSGRITARVKVVGDSGSAGETTFFVNQLGANVAADNPADGSYTPGEEIPVSGNIAELNDVGGNTERIGVGASFKIQLTDPEGNVLHTSGVLTASSALGEEGDFAYTIPAGVTTGLTAGSETEFKLALGINVIDASYTDPVLGDFVGNPAGVGSVNLLVPPSTLLIDNLFSSPTGWVKPGETFPFRVFVSNYTNAAKSNVTVTIPHPDSVTFVSASPLGGAGSANTGGGNTVTWNIGTLAAASGNEPTVAVLLVEAQAATLAQDPEIVWKDLSNTATLAYTGGPGGLTATAHGPKVIPPLSEFDTARYGDKPFVMVPVDFTDRSHDAAHTGDALARKVNSPDVEGSTFNLYQEMSFGQLYPNGTVPSLGIASAGFDYAPGFEFSQRDPTKPTCRGKTFGDLPQDAEEAIYGTPLYPERIHDGWYQLPGDTEYYGGDFPAFTLGVGSTIDGACGSTSKSVYDAAVIADPEINYDDYDLDKDGVVDFFMMVFTGLGGNGDSQINGSPPYDNIWPHSSSLEYSYTQAGTGLKGYVSDDQLTSHEGVPQCWTNASYTVFDDCAANGGTGDNSKPVYVRVGPYNVNPESAIDQASVISHEYGHHLGVPDFYSTSYTTYNDWNLMATDYSQHMTVYIKQEYGWVVPTYIQPGQTVNVDNWNEIKNDTGKITWQRPDGTFYTLSAANGDQNVHNGEVYAVKLPRRQLIERSQVETEASLPNVMYSGRGNDFGCTPVGAHNLDIALPELASIPDGTNVTLTFKSKWDIEWDFDYGFTLVTTNGTNYTSLPSANSYTTPAAINPNNSACQQQYGNGLTGTSGSYRDSTFAADRNAASPIYRDSPFLEDEYDLSAYAGQSNVVLRFSYSTDPGLDRPGWFIDDLKVTAGSSTIYSTNFTDPDPLHVFPGGCGQNGMKTADHCTPGWSQIDATTPSDLDHAYYLELRDRSGFDYNGRGQADRGQIQWDPGVLIEYTDESRGYGNNAAPPPRQHYIDSQPEPGLDCGEALVDDPLTARNDEEKRCDDAAFTAAAGDSHYDDNPLGGLEPGDWIDNFADDSSDDGYWHFAYNCLSVDVTSMSGADANEALPSNLSADAVIQALADCASFSYTGGYANAAPVADAQAKPTTQQTNKPIIFDGSGSTDDLTPTSQLIYEWDWDNNGTYDQTGQTLAHSFSTAGVKTVTLKVTDRSTPAKFSTDTVTVTITASNTNEAPIADAQANPTTQQVNKPITFDGSGSTDDQTPTSQLIFEWDWDSNGTYDQTGQTLAHSFSTTGVKTVTLKVTDLGTPAKSSTDTVQVTITSGPPPSTSKPDLIVLSQSYTPTTVRKGTVVTFRATVKNIGAATANASYTAWYRKAKGGQKLLGKVSTPSIPVGQTRQVGITFDTSGMKPGKYKIYIKADWTMVIGESKEKNNILRFTLVIKK